MFMFLFILFEDKVLVDVFIDNVVILCGLFFSCKRFFSVKRILEIYISIR